MPTSPLLSHVENFVKSLLSLEVPEGRPFHNFKHTFHVVQKCDELATYYTLPESDKDTLLTAAWFHDTGYIHGNINHEEESTKIASSFLNDLNVNSEFVMKVHTLIMATKLPAKPATLLEEILCDADLHHLASEDYLQWSNQLRQEIQMQSGRSIDESNWVKENISFWRTHHYFTSYAITFWNPQKQLNLEALVAQAD